MKAVLFDLDGTVMDSGPGIKHTAIRTLKEMHLPSPSYEDLDFFIGPPLRDCFRLCKVPEERIEEAVTIYRHFYEQKEGGYLNAAPYPGIDTLLSNLDKKGYAPFVCTSKAKPLAERIVKEFHLAPLFKGIYGASPDGSRAKKKDIIAKCLTDLPIGSKAIMIGDTYLDIEGADANHIPSIGVTWGYGVKEKMIETGAYALVSTMDELEKKILEVLD